MQEGVFSLEEYSTELRREKHARAKEKKDGNGGFDRRTHCINIGKDTRFKAGQFVGAKSPRWKGGPLRKYGMTPEDYDRLLAEQGGVCAICGKTMKHRLNVDHDHKTGKVRGLLCFRCNYGMAWFGERVEILQKILEYLRRAESCP